MLSKIFPNTMNNNYQGSIFAKYIFIILTVMTIVRSLIHLLGTAGGAESIASIPVETYSIEAQKTVILIFHLWGLSQLIMGIVYVAVIFKYQQMISFFYLLMFFEYSGRTALFHLHPIQTLHTAPGAYVNYIMIPLSLIMCFLALPRSSNRSKK